MKTRKPISYLRLYRRRSGLTQRELAELLACNSNEVISRIEKKQRGPTLKLVIACFILFGTSAAEMFPDIARTIDAEVMDRIWDFYERIQGNRAKSTKAKIELLEAAIERHNQRNPDSRV